MTHVTFAEGATVVQPVKPKSIWKDHDHWTCLSHVPPISLPATSSRCWMVGCGTRPDETDRPAVRVAPPPPPIVPVAIDNVRMLHQVSQSRVTEGLKCAYPPCKNEARDGSKYCCRACSNRNARKRHKERARHAA